MPKRKSNETLVDILPHYRRVTIVSIDSCNWLQDVIVEAVNQVIQVRPTIHQEQSLLLSWLHDSTAGKHVRFQSA